MSEGAEAESVAVVPGASAPHDAAPDPPATADLEGTPAAATSGAPASAAARWWRALRGPRGAAWAFGLYLAAAVPLLVFHLADFFWFFRDDWIFITDRELRSADSLFEPHNGHWVTVPVVVFRLLYAVFGIRTYVPYQLAVVAVHLGVVVLVRIVMRRVGVGPWLATVFASALVLFGSGREDIVWAFQVGFTGAVMLSLLQLVLADHEGESRWRDGLAVLVGMLAVAAGSPAIPLTVVMAVAILVRRGWRAAAVQTVPLGLVYLVWRAITHPVQSSPFGRPPFDMIVSWVQNGQAETFLALAGRHQPVAAAFGGVLVVGLVWAVFLPAAGADRVDVWQGLRRIATPLALLGGVLFFMLLSVQARWFGGPSGARAGRYVYFYAACTLPALAVAAQELARRWRAMGPILVLLVLFTLPPNIARIDDEPFGPGYHAQVESVLTASVRMPFAREVPGDVRPLADPFLGDGVTMDFLLHAYDTGKLDAYQGPIPQPLADELEVRLGFAQSADPAAPTGCRWLDGSQRIKAPKGTTYVSANGDIGVSVVREGGKYGAPVRYSMMAGNRFTVVRSGVEFEVRGAGPPLRLCQLG